MRSPVNDRFKVCLCVFATLSLRMLGETVQWLASKDGGQLRCLGLRGCRIGAACASAFHVALLPVTGSSAAPAAAPSFADAEADSVAPDEDNEEVDEQEHEQE